jgi:hypothetical protein
MIQCVNIKEIKDRIRNNYFRKLKAASETIISDRCLIRYATLKTANNFMTCDVLFIKATSIT